MVFEKNRNEAACLIYTASALGLAAPGMTG